MSKERKASTPGEEKKELTPDEIENQTASELPDREEMSLIGTPHFLGPPVQAPPPEPDFLGPPVQGTPTST
jgi:hypothetical protein